MIYIDQPDFSMEFNHQQKVWIATWTAGVVPAQLWNSVSEYLITKDIKDACEQ